MRHSIISALVCLTLLAVGPLANAGERLELRVKQSNTQERITIYLQGDLVRIVSTGNPNAAVLFDAKSRQLSILDHQRKTVTKIDQATIGQLASVADGVGELARSQGGVLGDLFKTFGLDNAIGKKAVIEQQPIAGEHQYAGVSCQMTQVSKNGQLVTHFCLSTELKLAAPEKNTLSSLINFGQMLVQKGQLVLDQFNLSIPQLPNAAIEGVPIYVKNIPDNTIATLLGIEPLTLNAGQFAVPTGYNEAVLGF